MKVILYSTAGCHLCDQAKGIIWPLLLQYQFRLQEIDIADDDNLISKYGVSIPVLVSRNSEQELRWPFSADDVNVFFSALADKDFMG
jgi:glutaredoxin